MALTTEQLAEILAGIARAQQAVVDAIESQDGGFRNTHLVPKLNVAANSRQANARLIDIPARILLRSQSRVPMDIATIARDLEAAMSGVASTPTAPSASSAATPAATPAAAPAAGGDDLNFS